MASSSSPLVYEGCNYFRARLVLSSLSGRSVKIKKIREDDDEPGLKDFEASFIRLLDKITNGARIEINETGTTLFYQPGVLIGGTVDHDCNEQRSIGYYLEALVCLMPFCKKPLKVTLRGVTNDGQDPSVDTIKSVTIPVMKKFGFIEGLELKILKRGASPGGGGEIVFTCPVRKNMRPIQLKEMGKVKRIRGVSYSMRVSPAICNRVVDSAKAVLNKFLTDVYIYTDHCKGPQSGKSPGFGLSLLAETTKGAMYSAECTSNPPGQEPTLPEDLGKRAAQLLLEEIYKGGCVDSNHQSLALLFMVLGQRDVSKIVTGPLSPYTIEFLRMLRDFFQVMFKIEVLQKDSEDDTQTGCENRIQLSCIGVGYTNISKSIT